MYRYMGCERRVRKKEGTGRRGEGVEGEEENRGNTGIEFVDMRKKEVEGYDGRSEILGIEVAEVGKVGSEEVSEGERR